MKDSTFLILMPDLAIYRSLSLPPNATAMYFRHPVGLANDIRRMTDLFVRVPSLARRFAADVCLSLGDLSPIGMPCPNVCFLQQALFLYGRDEIDGQKTWPALKKSVLSRLLARTVSHSENIIVQTPVMASRLAAIFPIAEGRISIISSPAPNNIALPNEPMSGSNRDILNCRKPTKLLFLAAPYPHKNHAILPAVADRLRGRNLSKQVHIFVTLDDSIVDSAKIRKDLSAYPDVIANIGSLTRNEVAGALRSSTALFLPTLVESYGHIYVEAMNAGLPILTSNRDFARWMCRDLALYFEPSDPESIVNSIIESRSFPADPWSTQGRQKPESTSFPRVGRTSRSDSQR